ncbi:polysaccharide pyruvyl transferase family protein [Streptococcus equinus]|uniref:polysaccharide pyruvyl transferase family protein n=1 Tax=Streptococcus equinus TaxID=1335 RepID=UPI000889AEDE|nr:polysaccharide pyruvyl transferase family protein [Streptococcus equinus]SDQ11029.1 Polysaccharide pyruvyl transferase [Streptococcus equinus]
MKCYIATYYQYDNYGTRLQNYALKRTLEQKGVEVNTIYLKNRRNQYKDLIKELALKFVPNINVTKRWKNDFEKRKKFQEFNKYLNLVKVTKKDLFEQDYSDSFAIAGSDQIWSPLHLENNPQDVDLFFCRFISKEKRYSYAPSFGTSSVKKHNYYDFLKDFKKLSVREEQGKKIIESLIQRQATVVPDPVFLLSSDDWKDSFKSKSKIGEKYVVVYFLSQQSSEVIEQIEQFSKDKGCSIINIMGNSYNSHYKIPNPIEFVELLSNASYVFTDSFHASVFSIIFQTKFTVLSRTDVKQISRIENLLKIYHCSDFMYNGRIADIDNRKISEEVGEILKQERDKGQTYLNSIIKEVKKYE